MSRKKILIVDDDQDIRLTLSIMLRKNNYDIVLAEDALSAVTVARKEKPDLILLDLGLPAGDGFIVMGKLKGFVNLDCIPVIVVTARDPYSNKLQALKAGAEGFFQKPVDPNKLLPAIKKALGES